MQQYTARRLIFESWDVWHLHWPEQLVDWSNPLLVPLSLAKFWVKLMIARAKGVKIFWTVHNLRPHERRHPFLERLFWRVFLPNVDAVICMTESGRQQLNVEHPSISARPCFVIPLGHYRGVYPDAVGRNEARLALGIGSGEIVVVFVGLIRAYKGVPQLIRCYIDAAVPNSRLLVAGEPQNDMLARAIEQEASGSPAVQLHLKFLAMDEVQLYLRAADLVALPYKDILNSASALLALSFDRPVLVPDRGAMGELQAAVGARWVRLYAGGLTSETLRDAMFWAKDVTSDEQASAPLEPFNWDHIARLTLASFDALSPGSLYSVRQANLLSDQRE